MADYRLRNYIPISGPATREPIQGDEPDLRVSLGFCPRWYHRRLGIDFGEKWHREPGYRSATLVRMKTALHEAFPELPQFRPRQVDGAEWRCATISGVYGIKFIPMLYGLGVQYRADDWPDNCPGEFLSKEALARLEPFEVADLPPMRDLLRQMDEIEAHYGQIEGYLNYQGILNIALKLRGNDIFLDLYDDPDFAHHLFTHIAGTIARTARLVQQRQRQSGFAADLLSMSNCVMNMVSPEIYREFVLPHERALSGQFARFGIHTCNWNATPYLHALRAIDKMGYLDMGAMSDLRQARDLFPDARRAVFYSPVDLDQKTPAEILAWLRRIREDYAPCDIVLADIAETTEDWRVRQFLDAVAAALAE